MTELEVKILVEQSSQGQLLIDATKSCELEPRPAAEDDVADSTPRLPTTFGPGVCGLEESPFLCELRGRPLRKKDLTVKLAYRCLFDQFEAMLKEEPIAWEGANVEGVHQMRVATRRIRAAFRAFKSVLPPDSSGEFRSEFKWLARVFGNIRDLDVQQDNLRRCLEEFSVEEASCLDDYRQHLATQWQEARRALLECLAGERYQRLKSSFAEFLQRGPAGDAGTKGAAAAIRDDASRLIRKQYKRVLYHGRSITHESHDAELHALRIDCKRLRYLFEFFRNVYGESLNPFIKRLKTLQDVLGEFQDAHVAKEQLRHYADGVPMLAKNRGQLLALGQFIAGQRLQAANRRAQFHEVWKRFDRQGARRRMLAVLN